MNPNKRISMFSLVALATSAGLLAACADDEQSNAANSIVDKLHSCRLVTSQGELNFVVTTDEDTCRANCFIAASCEDSQGAVCGGLEDGDGNTYPRSERFEQCAAKCEVMECDGKELATSARCDGVEDCSDGKDEADCFVHECSDGSRVTSRRAIVCDGLDDCEDKSDEEGCKGNKFQCKHGWQLPAWVECDLVPDCLDGSDEHQGCAKPICE